MRVIFTALCLITFIGLAQADIHENAGEYGFQFLQMTGNPIAAALAGTGIYATNYAGAYLYQPAAGVREESFNLSIFHSLWLVDTNHTQLSYSHGNNKFHFGVTARMLDYGTIESRDETGQIIGEYHPLDVNLMTNFAYRLLPEHLLGINTGLIYEKLDANSCYGISTDLGYIYLTPFKETELFLSLRNLGYTSKMDKERIHLPISLEAGISRKLEFSEQKIYGQIAFNKAVDTNFRGTLSVEYIPIPNLNLRSGYKIGYDEETFTFGIGINAFNIGIDYAWVPTTEMLNDTHTFGITYHF